MTGATGTPGKKTLYEILGVGPDATLVEIQVAHQALAGAALDQAVQVAQKEAYRTLSDARRRALYDKSLRERELPPVIETADDDEASGSRKKPLIVLAVVVLLAGAWWFTRSPGKPASAPAVPVARAVPNPAPATSAEPQATAIPVAAEPARDTLLFGSWLCQGPLTGGGFELSFATDGTFSGQASGQPLRGDYAVNGAALTFRDSEQSNAFTIEELAPQRLVINRGEGKRLACSR
jgi:curved DNA-binding protein CbpA